MRWRFWRREPLADLDAEVRRFVAAFEPPTSPSPQDVRRARQRIVFHLRGGPLFRAELIMKLTTAGLTVDAARQAWDQLLAYGQVRFLPHDRVALCWVTRETIHREDGTPRYWTQEYDAEGYPPHHKETRMHEHGCDDPTAKTAEVPITEDMESILYQLRDGRVRMPKEVTRGVASRERALVQLIHAGRVLTTAAGCVHRKQTLRQALDGLADRWTRHAQVSVVGESHYTMLRELRDVMREHGAELGS